MRYNKELPGLILARVGCGRVHYLLQRQGHGRRLNTDGRASLFWVPGQLLPKGVPPKKEITTVNYFIYIALQAAVERDRV